MAGPVAESAGAVRLPAADVVAPCTAVEEINCVEHCGPLLAVAGAMGM
jgi:hypothetical protein